MDMTTPQTNPHSARQSRELARRLGWLTEAQAALGWGVVLVLAALLGVIYLTQASHIAAVGRRVQVLQNQLIELKRENAEIERHIAEAQSLGQLQQEAVRRGFAQANPEDIEYITVPNYPAKTAALEATPEPTRQPQPPQTMAEAVWLTVQHSVGHLVRGEARE
jgi:type VI protein secretion system component VasK